MVQTSVQVNDSATQVTYFRILILISIAHFLSDLMTSVVPALLPLLQRDLGLSYAQLGTIVMVSTLTASLFQPVLGWLVDKRPVPWLLPMAALFSGMGLVGIAQVDSYWMILVMAVLIGLGSATFHPEGSRVTHLAAGDRKGLSQSIFQMGGNAGQAIGPLMIPLVFLPFGLKGANGLLVVAIGAAVILAMVAKWSREFVIKKRTIREDHGTSLKYGALVLLVAVVSMRSWIHSGVSSFLPLYYVNVMGWTITTAEIHLFVFLLAGAIGTFFGGVLADRYGKKNLMVFSMLGSVPFLIMLPYLSGVWSYMNVYMLGLISLSSFAVSVVYAQELYPGNVGMVSGLMIGFSIGIGGIGASVLGGLADLVGLLIVLQLLVVLPILGWIMSFRLPNDQVY
jgi:FSR family fosmidomycin resistance protein-like MFS transporter